jgi:hypothetical protein
MKGQELRRRAAIAAIAVLTLPPLRRPAELDLSPYEAEAARVNGERESLPAVSHASHFS